MHFTVATGRQSRVDQLTIRPIAAQQKQH